MSREELFAIIKQYVFVTDEWGGEKLASWRYGNNVCVGGIDEAVDAIIAAQPNPAMQLTGEERPGN